MKFNWFRKKEKQHKEEQPVMTTLEQIKKAYADLSAEDKKSFHQSIKDRVDESVGEQEHLDGDRDSQTAKDRIDEAEGAEKADEERKEDVHEERQDERTDRHADRLGAVEKQLADLTAVVAELAKKPKEADKDDADELDKITKKWNQ